jgi:hypothetical protein
MKRECYHLQSCLPIANQGKRCWSASLLVAFTSSMGQALSGDMIPAAHAHTPIVALHVQQRNEIQLYVPKPAVRPHFLLYISTNTTAAHPTLLADSIKGDNLDITVHS